MTVVDHLKGQADLGLPQAGAHDGRPHVEELILGAQEETSSDVAVFAFF